jgi:glycosyltransferase involved in cell wall biosynthesis
LGQIDQKNPSGIPLELILNWQENGWIKYLGKTDNVSGIVKEYTAVVLPSYYREGVPRSLLEAGALGKPIITTNNVGCKETVIDEVSGFICEAKNLDSLIDKLKEFINLPFAKKKEMGCCSRKHIENNFDEEVVINKYLERMNQI